MQSWENDSAYREVVRAFVDGDPLDQAGGPLDVRAVVAAIRPEARDGFLVEEIPWDRFPEGGSVRVALERVRRENVAGLRSALGVLGGLCANDMRAAAAPAVPFLLRIGAGPGGELRAEALTVAASVARVLHIGVCTRAGMLRFRGADEWFYEPSGYLANWSVQAARDAIAADAGLLLPLIDDPSPAVRVSALYALAAATDRARDIRAAFHARLHMEHAPTVRAALVLATAELSRAHPDPETVGWMHDAWSNTSRPAEVRVSAALGWLCLTDLPVPDQLRAVLDEVATEPVAHMMAPLPWMRALAHPDGDPLSRCLRTLLQSDVPDVPDAPGAGDVQRFN